MKKSLCVKAVKHKADLFCFYDPYFVIVLIYDENGNHTTETNGILLK